MNHFSVDNKICNFLTVSDNWDKAVYINFGKLLFIVFTGVLFSVLSTFPTLAQSTYYTTTPTNSFGNSRVFRQEIARLEVTVSRDGKPALPLSQVPRVEENDVLKVRMLEEAVGGIKPDQSNWDWTLVVAFVNPNRNKDDLKSVTQEIRFRDKGWYKDYSFKAPYDSQPIIFLYTKPNYRNKISNLINKNPEEIRKLGEKTIEIAGAYAQIGSFLNELQDVLNRTQQSSSYNNYSTYNPYNTYSSYNTYSQYGNYGALAPAFMQNAFVEQTVERLAKSFNIQLPNCWGSNNNTNSSYNSYNTYNSYSSYGTTRQDLVGRVQCVAQNVRVEDLDISLSKMIQQGGVFAAMQLAQKYPQIAYWINLAAAAMDLIIKITKKSALKIVPTMVATNDTNSQYNSYQTNYTAPQQSNAYTQNNPNNITKISVYAENQPGDASFVTAFPVIVHKWQAEPDPEIVSLTAPIPLEPCLHAGQNILKNTDLSQDWLNDTFSRNFKLVMSSTNGFMKEFPLRKNAGMMGWDLNVTKEELNAFPKIGMTIESQIVGTRGFTELKSPKFNLAISSTGKWDVKPESLQTFTIGGKRRVVLQNSLGTCLCLQSVVYKPSFGGQFVFEANGKETGLQFSEDGKEVWFSIDATNFKSGTGTLEITAYGGEKTTINLKIYPLQPEITNVKISKGDREAVIQGERLEQLQYVNINGNKAKILPGKDEKERLAVFEDLYAKQNSETVSLELGLEEERRYSYPDTFRLSAARPVIESLEGRKEVDGDYIAAPIITKIKTVDANSSNTGKSALKTNTNNIMTKPQINLSSFPVIPINATGISTHIRNSLTDYDFKAENLSIETRIEKSEAEIGEMIETNFEVLDWKNMRLTFGIKEPLQKMLGGRRLQFRIKDKSRGNSDWYTIRQTFVRTPQIASVTCSTETSGNCELKGEGLDYIAQVSVDGGKTWYPSVASGLAVKIAPDGSKAAVIPHFINKTMLQIKLKDFSKDEGLNVSNFNYSKGTARFTLPLQSGTKTLKPEVSTVKNFD